MTQASASASVDHVSTLITLPDINWVWSDTAKGKWEALTDKYHPFYKYQQFYDRWRDRSSGSNFLDQFPYKLSLGVDENGASLLRFGPDSTSRNRILVTKAYDDMYHRLMLLRRDDDGEAKGAVLTGQPGIGASLRSLPCATTHQHISPGKTTFLKFMLVRLISARQVVLLCNSTAVHLFYRSQVYSRLMMVGCFEDLPQRKGAPYCPIWALIDVDYQGHGPPISSSSNIWPIQSSSPNPIRWKHWKKQNGAAMLGLPLWKMEELMEGHVFGLFSLSTIDPGHAA